MQCGQGIIKLNCKLGLRLNDTYLERWTRPTKNQIIFKIKFQDMREGRLTKQCLTLDSPGLVVVRLADAMTDRSLRMFNISTVLIWNAITDIDCDWRCGLLLL